MEGRSEFVSEVASELTWYRLFNFNSPYLMYCLRARLAFISCSNQAQGPLGRIILQEHL